MEQSTKLFIVLGFMFLLYVTMKGNLQRYLALLFGGNPGRTGPATDSEMKSLGDHFAAIRKGLKL